MENIFLTVIVISSITGILALLLSIANKTIGNYGEKKLIINDEKTYTVDGGDTLLSTLIENEIFIPSACGGKGSCGYCKVKVIEGGGQILPTELGYVTPEERLENIRLSCQLKIKNDIKIEIPKELFSIKQYSCNIEFIKIVTPKIKHLRINLPKDKEIEFKAGQYIQILAPKYKGNDEEIYRAYSIASSPNDKTSIELFVGYMPGGICTTYVHEYLTQKDKLTIIGPYGDFYYHDNDREMVMIAIGTGMAPIMSILKFMKDNNIKRKVTFYFGARTRDDFYMMKELENLKISLFDFTLVSCLSRPTEKCNWSGDVGRVNNLIEKYILDGENKEAYLCGSPVMIDSVLPILIEKGLPENLIYYDKFE